MFALAFSFDDILRTSLSSATGHIDCVISDTANQIFTLRFQNGVVEIIGEGDFHETQFDKYRRSISTFAATNYPTSNFYDKNFTNTPLIACASTVTIVVFTSIVLVIYILIGNGLERKLTENRKSSFVEIVAKEAKLKEKKIYVRYISHEVK